MDIMGCNYTGNEPVLLWRNNLDTSSNARGNLAGLRGLAPAMSATRLSSCLPLAAHNEYPVSNTGCRAQSGCTVRMAG
jgi:hypothetical protein